MALCLESLDSLGTSSRSVQALLANQVWKPTPNASRSIPDSRQDAGLGIAGIRANLAHGLSSAAVADSVDQLLARSCMYCPGVTFRELNGLAELFEVR